MKVRCHLWIVRSAVCWMATYNANIQRCLASRVVTLFRTNADLNMSPKEEWERAHSEKIKKVFLMSSSVFFFFLFVCAKLSMQVPKNEDMYINVEEIERRDEEAMWWHRSATETKTDFRSWWQSILGVEMPLAWRAIRQAHPVRNRGNRLFAQIGSDSRFFCFFRHFSSVLSIFTIKHDTGRW